MEYYHIPEGELIKVNQFRRFIQDNGYTLDLPNQLLFRYLVTSAYRMAPALSKILKMLAWRKENRIDMLLKDVYSRQLYSVLSKELHFIEHGYDMEQRPSTIIAIGRFRLSDILKTHDMQDILMVFHYYTEHIEQECAQVSRRLNRDYTGNVTIMDMKGLSLRTHLHPKAIAIFKTMILINTYYYPESCQVVYVVNSPPIFSFFWNLVHPLMNEIQHTKLRKLSHVEELLQYFSPDQLPCAYGGTCRCRAESALFDSLDSNRPTTDGVVTIQPGVASQVTHLVTEGDHVILSFSSLGCDTLYSVYMDIDHNDRVFYCHNRLASSNMSIVNNSFIVTHTGTLVFEYIGHGDCEENSCIGYEILVE